MGRKGNDVKFLAAEDGAPLQFDFQPDDPFENGFKWTILLGRIIGVSPIWVSPRSNRGSMKFRWRSLSTLHSLLLAVMVLVVFVPELWKAIDDIGTHETILHEMIGVQTALYDFTLLAIYIYWLRNAPELIRLFHVWSDSMKKLNLSAAAAGKIKGTGFPIFCLKITLILMITCVTEVTLFHIYEVESEVLKLQGTTIEERIYKATMGPLSEFLPHYSIFTSIPLMYGYKVGDFAWNFTDIFVILMCRALTLKFKEINEEIQVTLTDFQGEVNMEQKQNNGMGSNMDMQFQMHNVLEPRTDVRKEAIWKEIREKISVMCGLSERVTQFVAPLVLACYEYNIFFVMLNSIRFIYESSTGSSPYVYFSTFQFVMRVVLVTYYASQVHHSTEDILRAMERYPDSIFTATAHRLERMLARHPVGVTIGGTVTITRNMFISILSFLFTAEIVLLQAMSASPAPTG